jgi:hypothetical protein
MAISRKTSRTLSVRVTMSFVGVLAVASGCRGNVLASLKTGQVAEVHYRRLGCFSSVDRIFAFARGDDGNMSVTIAAAQDRKRGALPARQRQLLDDETQDVDQELEHARTTRETECTTRKEFDLVIRDGAREVRTVHLADASCSGPEALYSLSKE